MAFVVRPAVALAAVLLAGTALTASAVPITAPATASLPAVRDISFSLDEQCDLVTAAALAARHPGIRQFVVVASPSSASTTASVEVVARSVGGDWRCQVGPRAGAVGRAGIRPLEARRSGDGTTPSGVFPLGTVTAWDGQTFQMFGNRPDPGVRVAYRSVRPEDCWGATPGTSRYQRLVERYGCPGPDDEWLPRFGDVYSHAAVIGANLDPVSGDEPGEPALAAAIFLHRHSYDSSGRPRATSGCVSVEYDALIDIVTILDPALDPHFAIGTVDDLRASG
jgi:L,D-peptidoglycan transpeptidase YkuD (ErfK/YbiS/YcfS/YnhG family)